MADRASITALLSFLRESYPKTFDSASAATVDAFTLIIPNDCPNHLLIPAAVRMVRESEKWPNAATFYERLEPMLNNWRRAESERQAAARAKLETREEPAASGANLEAMIEKLNRIVGRRSAAMREPDAAAIHETKSKQIAGVRHGEAT